jgi:meiotically up-regulated gene 157 (Mug157) protein
MMLPRGRWGHPTRSPTKGKLLPHHGSARRGVLPGHPLRGMALLGLLALTVWSISLLWYGRKYPLLGPAEVSSALGRQSDRKYSSTPRSSVAFPPPSLWSTGILPSPTNITSLLTPEEVARAKTLCGTFFYSTLKRAVHVAGLSQEVFVATGDIDYMWTRDSAVQLSIYLNHHTRRPWLRLLVEGAVRRNAFNILQDPYANAYYHSWKDPSTLPLKDRVIGRGGFVATRNYELDSGAYFLNLLYDYYVSADLYRPEALLGEPIVFESVLLLVETWIVEQNHEDESPYRYFELDRDGRGKPTAYTGMTWTGFRPSDDRSAYGYLIPANIHAAAALERVLVLNDQIWKHGDLARKASKLLRDIEDGINKFGIVTDNSTGERMYAYEVDGMGGVLASFDDANVPSLLSIPLLGWSKWDRDVYRATRRKILSKDNIHYHEGTAVRGIGSQHTPGRKVWPMAMAIEGLTEEEDGPDRNERMAFQMRQLLLSACNDAMHESVGADSVCTYTRPWFEWVRLCDGRVWNATTQSTFD